jgi:AhpD family alkylhydroperoxidase
MCFEERAMIRYVTPTSRRSAQGVTAEVYGGMRREFGVHAEPIVLHSPVPELLAAAWIGCREHLVAHGRVPRAVKEAVATTVSSVNRCPFCVDAHAAMLAAAGHHATGMRLERRSFSGFGDPAIARAVEWAAATRSPGAAVLQEPPFSAEEAPELIGTAMLFHYINRPVTVFLGESPLPAGGRLLKGSMLWLAGRRFRTFVREQPEPGESLELLPDAELPRELGWAQGSEPIAAAWARFAAAAEAAGQASLPADARARVHEALGGWTGDDPGIGLDWLEEKVADLDEAVLPAAKLALLVAFAPYRVDAGVVASFRHRRDASDADLVGAVSWSAFAAARRIGSWLWDSASLASTAR